MQSYNFENVQTFKPSIFGNALKGDFSNIRILVVSTWWCSDIVFLRGDDSPNHLNFKCLEENRYSLTYIVSEGIFYLHTSCWMFPVVNLFIKEVAFDGDKAKVHLSDDYSKPDIEKVPILN